MHRWEMEIIWTKRLVTSVRTIIKGIISREFCFISESLDSFVGYQFKANYQFKHISQSLVGVIFKGCVEIQSIFKYYHVLPNYRYYLEKRTNKSG